MKLYICKQSTAVRLAGLLAVCAIFCAVAYPAAHAARAASATERQLPIYCVQVDQKVCSISFDAAWGDGCVRQTGLSSLCSQPASVF